jgi:hypothetical protein
MFAQATKDFDQLKSRRKTTLTTGDYDLFPAISRLTRSGFPGGSASHWESSYLMSIVVQHLTPLTRLMCWLSFLKGPDPWRSPRLKQPGTAKH